MARSLTTIVIGPPQPAVCGGVAHRDRRQAAVTGRWRAAPALPPARPGRDPARDRRFGGPARRSGGGLPPDPASRMSSNRNTRDSRAAVLLQPPERLPPVDLRQRQVHDDHVRLSAKCRADPRRAVAREDVAKPFAARYIAYISRVSAWSSTMRTSRAGRFIFFPMSARLHLVVSSTIRRSTQKIISYSLPQRDVRSSGSWNRTRGPSARSATRQSSRRRPSAHPRRMIVSSISDAGCGDASVPCRLRRARAQRHDGATVSVRRDARRSWRRRTDRRASSETPEAKVDHSFGVVTIPVRADRDRRDTAALVGLRTLQVLPDQLRTGDRLHRRRWRMGDHNPPPGAAGGNP